MLRRPLSSADKLCANCGVHAVWTTKEPLKKLLEETVRYVGHKPAKE